ncbi:hypothetical protein UA44_22145 [Klebsiella aerogenes]|nr:hypothetical protein UA44_22145 [Klebsiella aerogenes]
MLDENNTVVASHSAPLTIQRPHPQWSEQSPQAWWEATEYLIATLREKCASHWSAIKTIGLSGQMHGAVLLDASGEVIRPAILWNDTRCAQECAELEEMAPELHQVAGNLAMPGLPRRNCCGCGVTNRQHSPVPPACCCRRIFCATR